MQHHPQYPMHMLPNPQTSRSPMHPTHPTHPIHQPHQHSHSGAPTPTSATFAMQSHASTKRCEWIECPGAEDGSNRGHACEETWKWVVKKKVAVCAYCRLQV
ncbi:hypothetical protein CspeluHIS016_0400460 [Cutaneotrichosporon spelunceum]|uniref:Uncharacterized protein n=1 Tax=Cutaneotrichosporon spelunceum TaxID=1672016 RepID=A0AAD3TUM0_9TREE|nr:hypothetical protein CspeluHIS016_0400460 [Cutaneotrichosporon spelunceum]